MREMKVAIQSPLLLSKMLCDWSEIPLLILWHLQLWRKLFGVVSLGQNFCWLELILLIYYLCSYPASLKSHVHVTKAHLPIDIAKALSVHPSLVQKAVEAFYTRDAIQLRVRFIIIHNPFTTTPLTEPQYLGSASHVSFFARYLCTDFGQDDTNCLCTTCWTKVFPSKSLRTVEGNGGYPGMEMERCGDENSMI